MERAEPRSPVQFAACTVPGARAVAELGLELRGTVASFIDLNLAMKHTNSSAIDI
jgi:hypothetical protein